MNDFMASITDEQLFCLAKRFGWNALLWRKKFVGLLPEIHRRRIWKKKNFESIFEFAKNLAAVQRQNSFIEPKIEAKSLPGQKLLLNKKVTGKLLEFQEKGVDINELILKILEERESRIEEEKGTIAKEHGEKRSISGCKKKSEQLHHTQTFALSKKHDPRFLAPLCKEHHIIAHGTNVKFFDRRLSR